MGCISAYKGESLYGLVLGIEVYQSVVKIMLEICGLSLETLDKKLSYISETVLVQHVLQGLLPGDIIGLPEKGQSL